MDQFVISYFPLKSLIFKILVIAEYLEMARRQLPSRSTRGKHAPLTPQQEAEDNAFYAQLFGPHAMEEPEEPSHEQLKQQKRLKRKELLQKNIRRHTFARGHHYFFDLQQFQRVEGQPSYALDSDNAFGFTFSKEDKLYKGQPLSTILNRKYFGLPIAGERHQQELKTKNPCHEYLFDAEDKKYSLDRGVVTCQKVLDHLQALVSSKKVAEFKYLTKKDPQLEILNDVNTPLEVKRAILKIKLNQFKSKKQSSLPALQYQDSLMFHCSLDQRLHDRVNQLKKEISLSMVTILLMRNNWLYSKALHDKIDLAPCLFTILQYHLTEVPSVGYDRLQQLVTSYSDTFAKMKDDEPFVLIPCQVFSFSNPFLRNLVTRVINLRVTKINREMGFYSLKMTWAKLFKVDLEMEKPNPFNYEDYKTKMDAFINKVKELFEHPVASNDHQPKVLEDDATNQNSLESNINEEALLTDSSNPIRLFKNKDSVMISDKELLLLTLFSHLYNTFYQLMPLLQSDPEAVNLFASDFFIKHSLDLLKTTQNPIFGLIDYCLEYFCEAVGRPGPFTELNYLIEWQYREENGVGSVWRGTRSEEEWVSDSEEQQMGSEPVKKLKIDI